MKSLLYIYLAILLPLLCSSETQGTEAFYISPSAVGNAPELHNALQNIEHKMNIPETSYNHSEMTYKLDNITLQLILNEGKMKSQILEPEIITVSGGRI